MKCIFCEINNPNHLKKFENYNNSCDVYLCHNHASHYDHMLFYGSKILMRNIFSEYDLERNFASLDDEYDILLIDEEIYSEVSNYKRASITANKVFIYKDAVLLSLVEYLNENNLSLTTKVDVDNIVDYFRIYIEETEMIKYCFTSKKEKTVINNKNNDFKSLKKYNKLFKDKMLHMPIRRLYESTIFHSDDYWANHGRPTSNKAMVHATKVWFENKKNLDKELFKNSIIFSCLKKIETNFGKEIISRESKGRIGQEIFRNKLLEKYNCKCALCDIDIIEVLVASHAKPWRNCTTTAEKLSEYNGLLLCANHDKLFDRGLLTFDLSSNRVIVLENKIVEEINTTQTIDICNNMYPFFEYHNNYIFKCKQVIF